MNPSTLWVLDLILAVGTCFLLCVAVTVEWDRLRPVWRRVAVAAALQQAVIAYGAVESFSSDVPPGARAYLIAGSLIALGISTSLVLWDRFRRHAPIGGRRIRR